MESGIPYSFPKFKEIVPPVTEKELKSDQNDLGRLYWYAEYRTLENILLNRIELIRKKNEQEAEKTADIMLYGIISHARNLLINDYQDVLNRIKLAGEQYEAASAADSEDKES